jgi:hypothetical protein
MASGRRRDPSVRSRQPRAVGLRYCYLMPRPAAGSACRTRTGRSAGAGGDTGSCRRTGPCRRTRCAGAIARVTHFAALVVEPMNIGRPLLTTAKTAAIAADVMVHCEVVATGEMVPAETAGMHGAVHAVASETMHAAAMKSGGVEPAAVEPSAVEPSAVEPSAVEPSAVKPSAVETTAAPAVETTAAPVGDSSPAECNSNRTRHRDKRNGFHVTILPLFFFRLTTQACWSGSSREPLVSRQRPVGIVLAVAPHCPRRCAWSSRPARFGTGRAGETLARNERRRPVVS